MVPRDPVPLSTRTVGLGTAPDATGPPQDARPPVRGRTGGRLLESEDWAQGRTVTVPAVTLVLPLPLPLAARSTRTTTVLPFVTAEAVACVCVA